MGYCSSHGEHEGWQCPVCDIERAIKQQTDTTKKIHEEESKERAKQHDRQLKASWAEAKALREASEDQIQALQEASEAQVQALKEAAYRAEIAAEEGVEEQRENIANAWSLQSQAKVNKAYELYRAQMYDQALSLLKDAIDKDPSNLEAYIVAAWVLDSKGDYSKSFEYYKIQIDLLKTSSYSDISTAIKVLNNLPNDKELIRSFQAILYSNMEIWGKAIYNHIENIEFKKLINELIKHELFEDAKNVIEFLINKYSRLEYHAYLIEINNRLGKENDESLWQFLKTLSFSTRSDICDQIHNIIKNTENIFGDKTISQLKARVRERYNEWVPEIADDISEKAQNEATKGIDTNELWFWGLGFLAFLIFMLWQVAKFKFNFDAIHSEIKTFGFFLSCALSIFFVTAIRKSTIIKSASAKIETAEKEEREKWAPFFHSNITIDRPSSKGIYKNFTIILCFTIFGLFVSLFLTNVPRNQKQAPIATSSYETQKTPTPQQTKISNELIKNNRIAPTKVDKKIAIPLHSVGTEYVIENKNFSNPKLSYVAERKILSVEPDRIIVTMRNLKSNYSRTLEYDHQWNLISARGTSGEGSDYSPPIKYYDFPLYPGKRWSGTSTERNIRTGKVREHVISAEVGEWETITVPAGTFQAIKVIIKNEVKDFETGLVKSGTDISWYAPDVKRSIKSELSTHNDSEGEDEKQTLSLLRFTVKFQEAAELEKQNDIKLDELRKQNGDRNTDKIGQNKNAELKTQTDPVVFPSLHINDYFLYEYAGFTNGKISSEHTQFKKVLSSEKVGNDLLWIVQYSVRNDLGHFSYINHVDQKTGFILKFENIIDYSKPMDITTKEGKIKVLHWNRIQSSDIQLNTRTDYSTMVDVTGKKHELTNIIYDVSPSIFKLTQRIKIGDYIPQKTGRWYKQAIDETTISVPAGTFTCWVIKDIESEEHQHYLNYYDTKTGLLIRHENMLKKNGKWEMIEMNQLKEYHLSQTNQWQPEAGKVERQRQETKKKETSTLVRAWNIDDRAIVLVNENKVFDVGYMGDSGMREIESFLKPGNNSIKFILDDFGGGWTFGFRIEENGTVLWEDTCGQASRVGCSRTKGLSHAFYKEYILYK